MKKLWTLFSSSFYLSTFTFGGGYVIVPLLRKKFVEDLNWIEENEMMDLVAIAQSSPGSLAVNATILIGYKIDGVRGALITTLGTVLPPLILLSIISYFYVAFKQNIYINAALGAMAAGVAAVVIDVVIKMYKNVMQDKRNDSLIIMVLVFIAGYFLNINIILIILTVIAYGVFITLKERRK
ncbi:chromate transporter [Erysipelothrix sp. HDW6A]|uniref:chromate transporter n=1 Tax=Erysipelothrix sp. HDW6A TaxID=2714928 RepID=UPI00140BE069|nr:chromate transporter [Erysipelothrix sp. HDW6A]QIK57221.1 chromate transporter [Erysipelothrix sp. HDW6A]